MTYTELSRKPGCNNDSGVALSIAVEGFEERNFMVLMILDDMKVKFCTTFPSAVCSDYRTMKFLSFSWTGKITFL